MCCRLFEICLGPMFVVALSSGCATVAGGLAGGALLTVGDQVITDGSQDVLSFSMSQTERAARAAMSQLGVDILNEKPTRNEGEVVRWNFEAAIVGDEVINVNITLERVTASMTRVRVRARRDPLSPDVATAAMIVDRIARTARAAGTK